MKKRIVAAMPLISIFLFLGAGLVYDNWRIAWTFFLLIPLSLMFLTDHTLKRISEAMPLLALVIFLWLGFGMGLWHPGWIVFLSVPVVNVIAEGRLRPRKIVTFIITGTFIAIGLTTKMWDTAWIIFLLIPIINTIFFPEQNSYINFKTFSFKDKAKKFVDAEFDDDF